MKRKMILSLLSGLLLFGSIYLWYKPKSVVPKVTPFSLSVPNEFLKRKEFLIDEVRPKPSSKFKNHLKPVSELEQTKDLEGEREFAFELLKNNQSGNTIMSPLGLRLALGMVLAGSREKTAVDIAKTLRVENNNRTHDVFSQTLQGLSTVLDPSLPIPFHYAGRVWVRKGNEVEPSFEAILEENYDAPFEPLDFQGNPGESRSHINQWIETQTNQKIKNFIETDNELVSVSLLLTNVIYFKEKWAHPFAKWMTHSDLFHVAENTTIQTPMMNMKHSFPHGHFDNVGVLELPYAKGDYSMVIVLPDRYDLPKIQSELKESKLKEWLLQLKSSEVELKLPKFEFEKKISFKETLSNMGMKIAFDHAKANFSGMTRNEQLAIDDVIQQAYVHVNEEGTEAAAATKISLIPNLATLPDPDMATFHADHPFLFFILDKKHSHILFMGRVVDPTK